MISILFSLSLNRAWAGFEAVNSTSAPSPAVTVAAPSSDLPSAAEIDKCLEDQLRRKLAAKKAAKDKADEEAKTRPPNVPAPPAYPFHPVVPGEMPGECAGDLEKFKQSLALVKKFCDSADSAQKPINGPMRLGCRIYSRDEYCSQTNTIMTNLANVPDTTMAKVMAAAKQQLDWYANGPAGVAGQSPTGFKYTGYYGAELEARRPPCTDKFPYPVYKTPSDLRNFDSDDPYRSDAGVKGRPANCGIHPITGNPITTCRKTDDGRYVPYYTREEINAHALNGKGAEIGCVANPIDIAFFQIQGDGEMRIYNEKGVLEKKWRLNTAEYNGREGYLLGNVVNCAGGKISSMTSIRNFLVKHERDMMMVLNRNPSYLFFDQVDGGAPKGVEGISLVEGHSLATDRRFLRTGAQALFDVPGPGGKHDCALANAVDKGSAINDMHGDLYKGEGVNAFFKADALNANGAIFIAVPKAPAGKAIENCKLPAGGA